MNKGGTSETGLEVPPLFGRFSSLSPPEARMAAENHIPAFVASISGQLSVRARIPSLPVGGQRWGT